MYYRSGREAAKGYSLCEGCERNNHDSGRHDRAHIFLQIRRPIPAQSNIPRVVPKSSLLYDKDVLKKIRASEYTGSDIHKGVTCSECKEVDIREIGRAVQQECRDRSRMPSSA
eukprot:TRINITY_DN17974_c0_g2_i4.p1 TRINITY_DN17974_c0_g2~~TRINITY_DN17974_c0_g2_i4.p1  ORF type:complete len:113 (+),score=15.03 TRINITY_DN17974_c0_g2_i4:119-457(+)